MKKKEFMIDGDIPNVLVFHPNVDLHDDRYNYSILTKKIFQICHISMQTLSIGGNHLSR